jgi:hypothetical protein
MTILTHLLHSAADGISVAATLYAATAAVTALTAIAAPTAARRRDARATLKLILRKNVDD